MVFESHQWVRSIIFGPLRAQEEKPIETTSQKRDERITINVGYNKQKQQVCQKIIEIDGDTIHARKQRRTQILDANGALLIG